jgi:hypothetical protein
MSKRQKRQPINSKPNALLFLSFSVFVPMQLDENRTINVKMPALALWPEQMPNATDQLNLISTNDNFS